MSEVNELAEPATGQILSRRDFVGLGAGAALAALLLPGCGQEGETLPTDGILAVLPEQQESRPDVSPLGRIDVTYLGHLLTEMSAKRGNTEGRLGAVATSLRMIKSQIPNAEPRRGTGFQIDESGIYITARHVLPDADVLWAVTGANEVTMSSAVSIDVANPYNGEASAAQGFIAHTEADMAIVYAPTGQSERPTPDMQITLADLHDGDDLWLLGLRYNQNRQLLRMFETGRVNTDILFQAAPNSGDGLQTPDSRIAVPGMIPYGGTSGSPVVNNEGVVVAVESGSYPQVRSRKNYEGAIVAPMAYAATLPEQTVYTPEV